MAGRARPQRDGPSGLDRQLVLRTGALLVVLFGAWWFGVRWFEENRIAARREIVAEEARQYRASLSLAARSRVALVEGLRRYVERQEESGGLKQAAFDAFAEGEYANSPWIRTIQVAPGGVIRWTYPLKGNEAAVGLDLSKHPDLETRFDAMRTLETTAVTLSGPIRLAQGGMGLVIRQSIRPDGRVWGLAAVVTDMAALLQEAGVTDPPPDMTVVLWDHRDRVVAGDPKNLPSDPVTATVELADATWRIALAPRAGWGGSVESAVEPVRVLGLTVVALLTVLAYTTTSRRMRLTHLVEARTRALGESERRYRTLFEESPVSLWEEDFSAAKRALDELAAAGVTDLRAHLEADVDEARRLVSLIRVADVNQVTVGLYGARDREQLMSGLDGFVSAANAEQFVAQLVAVAEGRKSFSLMTRLELPEGSRHVAVSWTVVPGHEEDYASVVVCAADLTDRVRAEEALQSYQENLERIVEDRTAELVRVNEELTEAQRTKDAFMASMSHELRTPLNSILGFTGVLLQRAAGPLTDEQDRQLEMVRRSGRQLLALVNDVLDLAKLEGGHTPVELESIGLGPFARSVVETVRPLADQKGLGLTLAIERSAPERLMTDRDHLRQVLLNLLSNAIKFTDLGAVAVSVGADLSDPGVVVFAVEDTGHGIPDEGAETIFEPFRQLARDAGAHASGTGLGLAISRDLAALLGGSLRLARSDGGGSRFELRLPVDPGQPADDAV